MWKSILAMIVLTGCSTNPAWLTSTLIDGPFLRRENIEGLEQKGWEPAGLVATSTGDVYFTDISGHRILHLSPYGNLRVWAGDGREGNEDGGRMEAHFRTPGGIGRDVQGNLYIADTGNHCIRQISPQGQVTTLKNSLQVSLLRPNAVVVAATGDIYVSAPAQHAIYILPRTAPARKLIQLDPGQLVTAMALDALGRLWYADTQGLWRYEQGQRLRLAQAGNAFTRLSALAFTSDQELYVADAVRHQVMRFTGQGMQVIAGTGQAGFGDGPGREAQFSFPAGLTADGRGRLYLSDARNARIRRLTPNGENWRVETLARTGTQGFGDSRTEDELGMPHGVAAVPHHDDLVVSDYLHNRILRVSPQGLVRPLQTPEQQKATPMYLPAGVAYGPSGDLYVAASGGHRLYRIAPDGTGHVLAGSGEAKFSDGWGDSAHFNLPFGIAVDAQENIYVADQGNHRIRKIMRTGQVVTFAGTGAAGFREGAAAQAQFNYPSGLAFLPDGSLLVADSWNHRLRRIDAQGQVTTWAGTGSPGLTEGPRLTARLYAPDGVAVGPDGAVYVADTFNHRVRRILPDGTVQSVAGDGELLLFGAGFANGRGTQARFNQPRALTVGRDGLVYVADTHNSRLRRLQP
jgi:sugar lactone lactonase YvrE